MKREAGLREVFMQLNLENQEDLLIDARRFQAGQMTVKEEGWSTYEGNYIRNEDGVSLTGRLLPV